MIRRPLVALLSSVALLLFPICQPAWGAQVDRFGITYKSVGSVDLNLDVRMPDGPGPFPGLILINGGKQVTGTSATQTWWTRRIVS